MDKEQKKGLGWGMIIIILIGVALVTGFLFGWLGTLFDLPTTITTSGMGVVVGLTAAALVSRRRPKP